VLSQPLQPLVDHCKALDWGNLMDTFAFEVIGCEGEGGSVTIKLTDVCWGMLINLFHNLRLY